MAIQFEFAQTTGKTLSVTLQKVTAAGVLGDIWDDAAGSWAAAPTYGDASISLTEGASQYLGRYTGGLAGTIGSYTGDVIVTVHDEGQSNLAIATEKVYLNNGDEVTLADVLTAATSSSSVGVAQFSADRIWDLYPDGPVNLSRHVIKQSAGAVVDLAFDFARVLNPQTSLSAVTSIAVEKRETGSDPTIGTAAISQGKTMAYAQFSTLVSGRYQIKATVTTTDSQTLVGLGWLIVE